MKVYVKVPITREGSEAAKILIDYKVPVTLTACYEVKQVLIASALGACYIAPYLGRMKDLNKDAVKEVLIMQKILDRLGSTCKLLVASIRDTSEINELALNGVSSFTINNRIAEDLFKSQATIKAANQFQKDILKAR